MKSLTPWEYIMARRRFTLFPKLPIEIREEIWKMTLEPRLVEVWPKVGKYDGFYSRTPLPSVMTACRDSRAAVLPLYPLIFGGAIIEARIRLNFKLDTLYFDWKIQDRLAAFLSSITKQEAERFRYLAIDGYLQLGRASYDTYDLKVSKLKQSPSLRYGVRVNHRAVKVEEEEMQLILSAISCMSNLKELQVVCDAWQIDVDSYYQRRDEFAELTIFEAEEAYDLFPPGDVMVDYRDELFDFSYELTWYYNTEWSQLESSIPGCCDVCSQLGWRFPKPSKDPPRTSNTVYVEEQYFY